MAVPIVVVIRFKGDSQDLLARFETARQRWIETQDGDYERPTFHAVCKTEDGIAVVNGWESAVAHRAFGEGIAPHIAAVGMEGPDHIEHMRVERLGWD